MKKIIITLTFLFSYSVYCAGNDSINLSAGIEPVCELSLDAEPIASNLDLTTSQTDLYIARANMANNTDFSAFTTVTTFDLTDHLTHATMPSAIFSFSNLKGVDFESNVVPSIPMTSWQDQTGTGYVDMYLSYTGVPALSLVQGTYSTTWYMSCSIEPRI
jgi:hypothetical protein